MAVTIKGFASDWSVPAGAQSKLDDLYTRKGELVDNANDFATLQDWLDGPNKHKYLPAGNHNATAGLIATTAGTVIEGPGKLIATVANQTVIQAAGDDITIRGITVDGAGTGSIGVLVTGARGVVEQCTVENLHSANEWTRGISAETLDAVTIRDNTVRNLTATGNTTFGDAVGSVRGIYLWRNGVPTAAAVIEGNVLNDILGEEGDAIQVIGGDITDTTWRSLATVRNNRVHNANRRGIKIQAAGTLVEGNSVTTDATLTTGTASSPITAIHAHYTVIRDNYVNAPQLNAVPISTSGSSATRVVGLEVYNNTVNPPSTQHGIYGSYLSYAVFKENRVYGGSRAVAMGEADDSVIARNVESGGNASSAAIFVTSSSNRVRTLGNIAMTSGRKSTQNDSVNGTDDAAASYDSGRRNILSLATTATGGNLTLRRIGYTVEIVAYNVVFTGTTLLTLPSEFRPALTTSFTTSQWSSTGAERLRVRSDTGNVEFYSHSDTSTVSFVATYMVTAGAPTSLPGVSA